MRDARSFDGERFPRLLLAFFLLSGFLAAADAPRWTFGIVPQQSATVLANAWLPLIAEISRRSGVPLEFKTAADIPTFEGRLQKGEYDLAFMNPYHYTVFSASPGYRSFAREKDRKLSGIIVVPIASKVKSLSDLGGETVIFPSPAAFAASILARAEFSRRGVSIVEKYVASHDSVYRGVALGTFAAGGGIQRTFEALDPAVSSKLRVLATTPSYVPHAFAAHPRVPGATVTKILAAMKNLASDEAGRAALAALSFKGIEAGADRDWNEIRDLGIRLPVGPAPSPR